MNESTDIHGMVSLRSLGAVTKFMVILRTWLLNFMVILRLWVMCLAREIG